MYSVPINRHTNRTEQRFVPHFPLSLVMDSLIDKLDKCV